MKTSTVKWAIATVIALLAAGGGATAWLKYAKEEHYWPFRSADSAQRTQNRIRNGEAFTIVLHKTIGTAQAKYPYSAHYDRNSETMTVSGLNAITQQQQREPYPCKDLGHNVISLWGHSFEFDSQNHLIDGESREACGIIYFDSDITPK